jgi:hypothetical protein
VSCFDQGMERSNVLDGGNKWPKRPGTISLYMPTISDAELRLLRLRYNAAYSAYQSCVMALNEAVMSGVSASPDLLKNEAAVLRELTDARAKLLDAMAAAANELSA